MKTTIASLEARLVAMQVSYEARIAVLEKRSKAQLIAYMREQNTTSVNSATREQRIAESMARRAAYRAKAEQRA